MIAKILEEQLLFLYTTLESERAGYSILKGVVKQISGVRINLLIGSLDIAESTNRIYRSRKFPFGAKLSARSTILHIHEIIDSGVKFESRLKVLSDKVDFESKPYLDKINEFNVEYRKNGLNLIRKFNKTRDIYGHSDPDEKKVIGLVDDIDITQINKLAALTLDYRVMLIAWTSELKNHWKKRFQEVGQLLVEHQSGVRVLSIDDLKKCKEVIDFFQNEVSFEPRKSK